LNSITKTEQQNAQLLQKDQQFVWHPYSSLSAPIPAYEVVSAQGVYLKLADGRELIDGMSSWWATIHGYNHPTLNHYTPGVGQSISLRLRIRGR
jgi:adenosylmethionine-8-amino-7-oxononanoate aminotransferase